MTQATKGVALHCLRGEPAPEEVTRDWATLKGLPGPAVDGLWELLGPSLAGVDPALERKAEAFCRLYELPPDAVRSSLRVCRFVLLRASGAGLALDQLAADVLALSAGEDTAAGRMLVLRYDAARQIVRQSALEQALLDHGKLLVGVDVRVDRLAATDRGGGMDQPVILLTLRTREGERNDRTTMYLTPETFSRMKEAWARIDTMLGGRTEGGSDVG